ncbi:methylation-associated defense system restriction endonuclease subunit S MAD5 [Christiangramia sp. SM2212]|uniref:Restriction endonuclease subunit S n=1 Tax=Christiangramia sediminicola TaxID=3073267 RepID=A0ABU1ETK4_9FLAO|nr:restriction endonuclease subunit S [Christiangramia sp. SM2212]MDR5591324.1 restriction endonuclease subunit S [Christiangramia sp. SM2212]
MKTLQVKHKWFKESGERLDASYYLSDGPLTKFKLQNSPYPMTTLENESKDIFSGNIFKRSYVKSEEYGWPYITGSNMIKSDINGGKYVSKKYTKQKDKLALEKGWILITCSGTLGNTVFTNQEFEGRVATHDLIRVIPKKNNLLPGYIYSYLTSKYGNGLLTQSSYGGVVKHIEPHHIEKLPIPIFPTELQQEIDELINEVANLRDDSIKLFRESTLMIEKEMDKIYGNRCNERNIIKVSSILNNYQKRIDSPAFINDGIVYLNSLSNKGALIKSLKELKVKVTRPGIFKRIKVEKKYGLPYIKGSELSRVNPFSKCEYLSKSKTPFIEEQSLKENQILLTCAGTVGDTKLISKEYEEMKALGSQDIIRIEARNSEIDPMYLYAYLNVPIVQNYIQSLKYGSVIERVEPFHIDTVPVFLPESEIIQTISEKIEKFKNYRYLAFQKEQKAIELVEKEIEQWQK